MSPRRRTLSFDPIAEAARQWDAHGWHDATTGMAAVTSVFRAEQIFLARINQALEPFDLSFARYEMLRLLGFSRRGELPLGKVGARLQVHPSSVTNAADRLERSGLIRRRRHPDDARAVLAAITDEGRAVLTEATVELNEKVFTSLGPSDDALATLVEVIAEIRADHGDFERDADH